MPSNSKTMSRVALSSLKSLTFYRDTLTKARRVDPIEQLSCRGKACRLYQPEVVRCYNDGGEGIDIDWRCEADLPEKLRFGKVEVSCEGWERAGDPYVLKGSCGLDYQLVLIDGTGLGADEGLNPWTIAFLFLTAFLILVGVVYFCDRRPDTSRRPRSNYSPAYTYGHYYRPPPPGPPPPPYSSAPKHEDAPNNSAPNNSTSNNSTNTFRPGFWTGLGVGGLGATAAQRIFRNRDNEPRQSVPVPNNDYSRPYDWETGRDGGGSSRSGGGSGSRSGGRSSSSGLGPTRSATGYGSTNVR